MIFILTSLLFTLLLVLAQVLWKFAVTSSMSNGFEINKISQLLIDAKVILGIVLYIVATLIYFYLQSKYQFSRVQLVVIPLSLVLSIFAGMIFFNEKLGIVNYFGVIIIFIGIFLVVAKTTN